MSKSKTHMPKDLEKKCHWVIHSQSSITVAASFIPFPVADTIPISMAQITMIVSLGKVFDLTISDSVAKSIIGIGIAKQIGRTTVASAFKFFPGIGTIAGIAVGAGVAATLTEALGWLVADDFYRIYCGERPQNIVDAIDDLDRFRKR